jgi:hypothetical protein
MRPSFQRRDTSGTSTSGISNLSSVSEDETESPNKTWQASIEICHTSMAAREILTADPLRQPLVTSLAKLFQLMITPMKVDNTTHRTWYVESHFLQHGHDESSSRTRPRTSEGKEPSVSGSPRCKWIVRMIATDRGAFPIYGFGAQRQEGRYSLNRTELVRQALDRLSHKLGPGATSCQHRSRKVNDG